MRQKNKQDFRNLYWWANLTLLAFCVYLSVLPFASEFMSGWFPNLWRCQYLAATGKPCPFCYMTRDIASLLTPSPRFQNPLTIPAIIILCLEIPYRIGIMQTLSKIKNPVSFIIADIAIHSALFLTLVGYVIYFFVKVPN